VGDNEEHRRSALSGYYAAVTAMDTNIGRLLDWLESNGLRENTLVVFTADNGMNMGHHGIWGKGNGTYPPNMFDTAVKVPTLASRPGHVPQDLVCDKLLSQYDFMPTILGYAGVEEPPNESLPGRDFSSILRGESLGDSSPVFVLDEYGPTRMIRTERWKYVHRYPDGPNELYDLANDPSEARNLIDESKYGEKIGELRDELQSWFDQYSDPDIDGSKQNVMGRGQLGMVASEAHPKPFADDLVFFSEGR
ncbi:MAG: sulfatase-like hydrolase/transferase, partial [SAR202 cluster bacterium]|nr:sulfatase-like hydrolase/transferase [SAR202 cluster bacterium]